MKQYKPGERFNAFQAKKKKNWIQGAIKHPGALHRELGVKSGNKIPAGKLAAAAKKGGKEGKRARLAETLKGFTKAKAMKNKPIGGKKPAFGGKGAKMETLSGATKSFMPFRASKHKKHGIKDKKHRKTKKKLSDNSPANYGKAMNSAYAAKFGKVPANIQPNFGKTSSMGKTANSTPMKFKKMCKKHKKMHCKMCK